MPDTRFAVESLVAFARTLLERAGVRADIAVDVADVLVTADLLGHTTHGLALLSAYLPEFEKGTMAKAGEPTIVNARPAAQRICRAIAGALRRSEPTRVSPPVSTSA